MCVYRAILREWQAIMRHTRRVLVLHLRPRYVARQLKKRRGSCGRHGCCDLSLAARIWHVYIRRCLSRKNRTVCTQWQRLPCSCKTYPIDEKDKTPETKSYCNFYWVDEEEKKDKD